ncbi:AAA family ATPase [Acaryochloris marina]|uniref:nSTAND1 domain-containing NTPase n=1 Tax=Acaryochloris marina TaxID=155978 RepID=UPI001BAF3D6A|nr:AAA family ATPase [Acaryochloris marina]QUY42107.1 hypothetical protein I1H34_23330 [Acaryochloris marina S15]
MAQLLRWIAELVRQRNWYMLLVLVGVGLALLTHFGRDQLNQFIKPEYQTAFSFFLWGGVVLIILVALGFALKTLPRTQPPNLEDLAERKAIKGLRPFSQDDAEIFARLQRERLLQTCVEVITSSDFRFGILVGESGCGKTSVLQAGILPQFLRSECEFCGVYVRFSDQEPLAAIRQALAEQLEIPMEWLTTETDAHPFLALLTQAVTAADKPVVLFLDQFEQWYVHAKQPEDRQPFLQGLMAWYKQPTPPVKILVSIRSDLFFHIVEIQKALHFDLGPQDVFQLAKFTPAEATQVLAVIAHTENLRFEESFVMELAEQELAGREDGLISPVDVQILAWMIERQNASELRAFNRQAFQKFGGVEGLLMRFLDKALMARVSEGQRQAALKVLLALTDLERQVRAGVLTVSELQQKLTGSLSSQEVREAVRWLERGDVRLITPINRQQQEVGYELAHERLIPSLLKQAGRELSAADQANQLLDRRVNEWLGNNRSGRYLFGPRELWSIKQQKPYLTWGPKRPQKEKLLALSWRRVQGFTGALMAVCLGISVFLGWLWYMPAGQIQQVRWALVNPMGGPLDRVSDEDAVSAAIAFAKDGKKQKAMDMVTQYVDRPGSQAQFFSQFTSVLIHETDHQSIKKDLNLMQVRAKKIDGPRYKSSALRAIAAAYGQINDPKLAHEVLKNALAVAEKFDDPYSKSSALRAIAAAYGQINDPKLAQEGLKNALAVAEKFDDPSSKSDALRAIAAAYGQINDPKLAQEGLKNALAVAEKIDDPRYKSSGLRAIAAAYGQINDPKLAHEGLKNALTVAEKIDDPRYKSSALRAIAAAYGQINDPKLAHEVLKNALTVAEKFDDPRDKSNALSAIAAAYGQINDPKLAHEVLKNALTVAEKFDDPRDKSNALSAIAAAYGQINDPKLAHEVLKNALTVAEKIDEPTDKFYALRTIAAVYGQVNDPKLAHEVLKNALTVAEKIDDPRDKSNALSAIAAAYGQVNDPKLAHEVLKNALTVVEKIDNPSSKSNALRAIADAYGQINDPKLAHEGLKNALTVAEKIDDPRDKSNTLRAIADAYGQINDPKLAQEGLKKTLKAAEAANAESVMEAISVKYAYLSDWGQSLKALRYCPESWKVKAQIKLLTLWAEKKNPRLINGAVIVEQPEASEERGKYTFKANLYGPTEGCNQYVDWWEILSEDQELLDRPHFDISHDDQQPFSSTSKPIQASDNQTLLIRAHLHLENKDKSGYEARQAWKGTIKDGFEMIRLPERFATNLAKADPQPKPCQDKSLT